MSNVILVVSLYIIFNYSTSYSNFGGENVDNGESIWETEEEEEEVLENEQNDKCLHSLYIMISIFNNYVFSSFFDRMVDVEVEPSTCDTPTALCRSTSPRSVTPKVG